MCAREVRPSEVSINDFKSRFSQPVSLDIHAGDIIRAKSQRNLADLRGHCAMGG
jgi:hypothetical protein